MADPKAAGRGHGLTKNFEIKKKKLFNPLKE